MRDSFKRIVISSIIAAVASIAGGQVLAKEGDILVRLRTIGLFPLDDSTGIGPDLLTTGLSPSDAVVPEVDFTYMATDNIGVELIVASSQHRIRATGALSSLGKIADVWLLPPTLLAQYHFLPNGSIRPYVGAGLNVTFAYLEKTHGSLKNALGQSTTVSIGNSVGWAVQGGVDIQLTDDVFLNLDIKYIDLDVDVKIRTGATTRTADVNINPLVIGIGIGMRF